MTLALAAPLLCAISACTPTPSDHTTSGVSPTKSIKQALAASDVFVSDDHDEALPFWTSRGERNRIVVHVDAHDDFRLIPEAQLQPVLQAIASGNPTAVAALADNANVIGSYNVGNYLYPAARAGVMSELIWVVPAAKGAVDTGAQGWQQWLSSRNYPAADVQTFSGTPDRVTGTLLGVKTTITTLEKFDAPNAPVLLDIDADFIPEYGRALQSTNPLLAARQLILELHRTELQVSAATVASSINGDYLQLNQRWVTEVVAESLVEPSIPYREQPPDRWALMGQAIADETGNPDKAGGLWREATEIAPTNPAPWYGYGRVLLAGGDTKKGSDAIEHAISLDPAYAVGWLQLGAEAASHDDTRAIAFVDRAKGRVDDFSYQMRRGDVLFNTGRYEDATAAYRLLTSRFRHPDAWMQLGNSLAKTGDRRAARSAYAQGLALLEDLTFRSVADYPDALPELGAMAEADADYPAAIEYYRLYLEVMPYGSEIERVTARLAEIDS